MGLGLEGSAVTPGPKDEPLELQEKRTVQMLAKPQDGRLASTINQTTLHHGLVSSPTPSMLYLRNLFRIMLLLRDMRSCKGEAIHQTFSNHFGAPD